ncbi:AAA family ATPase [Fulvivirgaceae bacterium PWU4]|uniref:AAA family ATPase n=1 Tax=Chryseosolibacter histidini TaxID=2782349 RepID=A0AAP2DPM9_9BACT|nr:AAA family ATPase [Chryseosolibacter histidini]MBT1699043.1 AAA family ATPase [Chryseosolibacter histidini]
MKTTGLTLGKFAPLHRGHQHLIETALQEMNEVVVVIYDAKEVTPVPLSVRAQWISKLYPSVEVILARNGPAEVGYTDEIKKAQEQYMLGLLRGRKITHFYSSEPYGEHMSQALGAVNRVVDQHRVTFPVSGTAIRNAPEKHTAFLNPEVYKDLITNIVFLGAPSTGKSTITEACARHFNTTWMPEYGREYWEQHNVDRRLTAEQLVDLARGHIEREDRKLIEASRYLFTDTNAITTFMFSHYYHGHALPALADLARVAESRYQLVFLCDTDIPYDDTWDRSGDANRKEFQQQIRADLEKRNIPFKLLSGTVDERVRAVEEALTNFKRYSTDE